jgi:hypothetical protein
MRRVDDIIDEVRAEHEARKQEQDQQAEIKLNWIFDELNCSHKVGQVFDHPDICHARNGIDIEVRRLEQLLCVLTRHEDGVRVYTLADGFEEDFWQADDALRRVVEILHQDLLNRPDDNSTSFRYEAEPLPRVLVAN